MKKLTTEQVATWIAENGTTELNEALIKNHNTVLCVWTATDVLDIDPDVTKSQSDEVLRNFIKRDMSDDLDVISNLISDVRNNTDTADTTRV